HRGLPADAGAIGWADTRTSSLNLANRNRTMKMKLPSGRVARGLIYLICVVLIALAIDLVLVRLARRVTPGERTTKITSPTLADGRIDYLKALENRYGEGVTSENNAAPLLLAAIGPAGLAKNQPRDGITARLGMPPMP